MHRITFKKYAGVKIQGKVPSEFPGMGHIDTAAWLTAQVESGGDYGTVISYDGTGMTAGLHQAIAVYPRALAKPDDNALNDQGPLWKLVDRCINSGHDFSARSALLAELEDAGLKIVNGVVRDLTTGNTVSGSRLRKLLSGSADGYMPKSGKDRKRAELWATLFHEFFSNPYTFEIQSAWGKEKLIKRLERTKLRHSTAPYWRGRTPQEVFYGDVNAGMATRSDLDENFDLAMCMWLSYTVNAPSVALRKLCKLIPVFNREGQQVFAKSLIKALGNSKWGRWDDDIKNGRYQRTRKFAMEIWPSELFVGSEAIMPKNLVG